MKKVPQLINLVIMTIFLTNSYAQNLNVSGHISTNTTWSSGSIDTVKVVGNITVDSLVTLTIEPGIIVDFTDNYFFDIKGSLIAIGTVSDSIKFTTSDTTGFYNNTHAGWSGIRIVNRMNTNDTTRISFCVIEYGKADGTSGLHGANNGGGLYFYQSWKIILNNSSVRNNYAQSSGGGLYEYYSFVNIGNTQKIQNCIFRNNKSISNGGAVYTQRGYETIFENCLFEKNRADVVGGAIFVENTAQSRVQINKCRFSYNSAISGGAIANFGSLQGGYITNSFLNNNSVTGNGGAFYVSQSNFNVKNCVIVNNAATYGGGLYFNNVVSNFVGTNAFVNNTIANNNADLGGGMYIYDNLSGGADLYINKTIFHNNLSTNIDGYNNDLYLAQFLGSNQTRFYSCSFTTNLSNTTGNPMNVGSIFNTNPQFVNPSLGIGTSFEGYSGMDWSLDFCTSPCIDATSDLIACECFTETDLASNPRKTNNLVDIGAYEADGFITYPANTIVCPGEPIEFTYTYSFENEATPTSYWEYSNDGGLNYTSVPSTLQTYIYSSEAQSADDGVMVRVRQDYGCKELISTVATINVYPLNDITISVSETEICQGETVTLIGQGAESYLWDNDVINGVGFIPSFTETYTVIGTDSNGCSTNPEMVTITVNPLPIVVANATETEICAGTPVMLTGSGALSYDWTNGVLDGVEFTPTLTDTYIVTGTDVNNCVSTGVVIIEVNQPNVSAISTSNQVCEGASVTLTGDGAETYEWSDGVIDGEAFIPSATHTYTVIGTDENNCTNTAAILITVNQLPNVSISAAENVICFGEMVTLTGTGASSYSWMPGSLSGEGINVTPLINTTYIVTGTDLNNCLNTASIDIIVNALPDPNIGPDSLWVCDGEELVFSLENTDGVDTYTIMTAFESSVDNSLTFTYNISNPPSIVQSSVTGTNGCTSQDVLYLVDNTIVNLFQGIPVNNDPTFNFSAIQIPSNVDYWIWDFGDGTTLEGGTMAQHTYLDSGAYTVCLIAFNECGSVSDCWDIQVNVSLASTNEIQLNTEITAYPNPTNGIIYFSNLNMPLELNVYSMTGQLIFIDELVSAKNFFDLSNYENGMYFIEVIDKSTSEIKLQSRVIKVND